jgi:hypothetical protein
LVNYWSFNGDFNDYVGGANGSPSGTITLVADRFGNANKAVFLRSGAYFSLPSGVYISGPAFSLMGWTYLLNTACIIFYMLGNGATSDNVYYGAISGTIRSNIINQISGALSTTPSVMPLNTWTHTAFTFDGTNFNIFMNGSLIASNVSQYEPRNVLRTQSYLGVGGWTFSGNLNGNLRLDDFRIYNRAVAASEIEFIMTLF